MSNIDDLGGVMYRLSIDAQNILEECAELYWGAKHLEQTDEDKVAYQKGILAKVKSLQSRLREIRDTVNSDIEKYEEDKLSQEKKLVYDECLEKVRTIIKASKQGKLDTPYQTRTEDGKKEYKFYYKGTKFFDEDGESIYLDYLYYRLDSEGGLKHLTNVSGVFDSLIEKIKT